jgi:hypothetical protein
MDICSAVRAGALALLLGSLTGCGSIVIGTEVGTTGNMPGEIPTAASMVKTHQNSPFCPGEKAQDVDAEIAATDGFSLRRGHHNEAWVKARSRCILRL